jgi:oligopeptidase B
VKKLSLLLALFACACSSTSKNSRGAGSFPPEPDRIPTQLEKHGDVRVDRYFWMKDRTSSKVIDHLKSENLYFQNAMKPTAKIQKQVFEELKTRIKQDDSTVPAKKGSYLYYRRMEKGKDYTLFCRRKDAPDAKEEIMLNGNDMSRGHEYFSIGSAEVTTDENLLAYSVDTQGRRFYTVYFKNLKTGETLTQNIPQVTGNVIWAPNGKTLFYTQQNSETLRPEKVFRYNLDTQKSELVYFEKDETFWVSIAASSTDNYLFLLSKNTLSSEIQTLDMRHPEMPFKIFQKREPQHEYYVEDGGDRFFVVTNWKAKNFRLMETSYQKTGKASWKELRAHDPKILLQQIVPFKSHLVLQERKNGLSYLRVFDRKTKKITPITFKDPSYLASPADNLEFDQKYFRFSYESPTTPISTYDFDLTTGQQALRKQTEVLGGFESANYESQRLMFPSQDGTMVPVSIVYRKGLQFTHTTPLLLVGYGSYGVSTDPYFSEGRISLLDRGFVVAITHIRGGSELGQEWYEDGRQMKKKNTFYDFIGLVEGLHKKGISSPQHTYALGASAGGLLLGAVVNMRPDLFRGMVAQVPFVDALTTMLDPSIPMTTFEYDQWGNPNEKKAYQYIKSYSPYDNVKAQNYPSILAMTALQDSQVQYWEPAKWIAKLRELNTSSAPMFLKTDLSAGHGGKSGRSEQFKEAAEIFAYIIGLEQGLIH